MMSNTRLFLSRVCIVWLMFLLQSCALSDFRHGDKLVREGKFYSAIEYYLSFVEKNADHPRAPYALLEVGKLQENLLSEEDKAVETYRTLVHHYPVNDVTIDAQERLAKILKNKNNNYQQALTEFDKLIRAVPSHAKAPFFQFEISDCYTLLHQYEQANLEYETLIERYPHFEKLDEVYFRKANNNYIAGFYKQALSDYEKMITRFPDSKFKIEAVFGMGATHEELDNFEKAEIFYEQIKDHHPSPEVIEIRLQGLKKRKRKKTSKSL